MRQMYIQRAVSSRLAVIERDLSFLELFLDFRRNASCLQLDGSYLNGGGRWILEVKPYGPVGYVCPILRGISALVIIYTNSPRITRGKVIYSSLMNRSMSSN